MGEEAGNTQSHNSEHNFQESIGPLTSSVDYLALGASQDPRLSYLGSWEELLKVKDSLNIFKDKDWVIGRPFPETSVWLFRNKGQDEERRG